MLIFFSALIGPCIFIPSPSIASGFLLSVVLFLSLKVSFEIFTAFAALPREKAGVVVEAKVDDFADVGGVEGGRR